MKKRWITLCFSAALAVAGLNQSGCGNDPVPQTNCNDFFLAAFTNGNSLKEQTSYWDCNYNATPVNLALFLDQIGTSSLIGTFTWEQTSCHNISYQSSAGKGTMANIQGSITSGIMTFEDTFGTKKTNVSCTFQNL